MVIPYIEKIVENQLSEDSSWIAACAVPDEVMIRTADAALKRKFRARRRNRRVGFSVDIAFTLIGAWLSGVMWRKERAEASIQAL